MPTYTFNVQIVVPQAWSLLLFFLAQLVLFYGRRRLVDVFEICVDNFPIMRRSEGEELSRPRKQKILITSLLSSVIVVLILILCYNYFPITIRAEKEVEIKYNEVIIAKPLLPIQPMPVVEIKDEKVNIAEPLLPTQPISKNTFNVLIVVVLFLSFIGGLAVYFQGQVFNVYMLCANYVHVMSGWVGEGRGRLVNMYMCCTDYFHIMSRFGGRLVDLFSQWMSKKKVDIKNEEVKIKNIPRLPTKQMSTNTFTVQIPAMVTLIRGQLFNVYTFCTNYFHIIRHWIGNLLKSVKRSRPSVREIEIEKETDSEEELNAVPELNEEVLTVNPDDNERLKKYIQTIIESLESLADEIQQPLLAENDVKSVLKRVDEIPGLIQKSIASLEFVHGKLYSSF